MAEKKQPTLFDSYLNGMALLGAEVWEDAEKLLEHRRDVAEDFYKLLKYRDRLDHRLAGLGVWGETLKKKDEEAA